MAAPRTGRTLGVASNADVQDLYTTLVRGDFCSYCQHVNDGWIPTRFHRRLCNEVQDFIVRNTSAAYDILVVSTPPQHGKQIADDEPVLTRNGWKRHGDLVVGDEVIGLDGSFVKVLKVFPKYEQNCTVTFTNGEKIQCHENHEWYVHDRTAKKTRAVETKYIEKRVSYGGQEHKRGHRYNFMIPNPEPIVGEEKDLAVHPYVLGAWLGDGTNTKQFICSSPKDVIVLEACSKHYTVSSQNVHKDTGVLTWYFHGLNMDLRKYGMCENTRTEKHIPEEYLTASKKQRLELLAGLIDTDGSLDAKHNRIEFTTADPELKDTFNQLISTFGWRTTTCEVEPSLSSSGIQGKKVYWQIGFNPTEYIPCRIERKQMHKFSKQRRISICNVERTKPVIGNCITVEGGIYRVGKAMIPTHNSVTITETLPSWYLGHFKRNKVIEISYSEDFAEQFGRRNRQKIAEYGNDLFGINLADSPNAATEFELSNHKGGMISRGIMSGVTGHGANLMIIDDPVKTQEEADSTSRQNKIWNEWLSSFTSRLAPHAKVIIIMTRWSENDLVGRLLETDDISLKVLNFPLEAESNDILGRKPGEALCPEIGKDDHWLGEFKKMLLSREGTRTWNALYQGHPVAMEGNLIHRDWWQYYEELPKEIPEYVMSVDAAFKDNDDSDFVAIQIWGKKDADMYLIDAVKKHLDMPGTCREIVRLRALYPKCRTTLIEDKANGSAIIQILRKTLGGVIAIDPFGGKVSRVNAIAGAIESGNCHLPLNKPFTPDFVDECSAFPNGAHDDQVDAMSQCLNRLIYHNARSPVKEVKNAFEEAFPFLKKRNKKSSAGLGDAINVI